MKLHKKWSNRRLPLIFQGFVIIVYFVAKIDDYCKPSKNMQRLTFFVFYVCDNVFVVTFLGIYQRFLRHFRQILQANNFFPIFQFCPTLAILFDFSILSDFVVLWDDQFSSFWLISPLLLQFLNFILALFWKLRRKRNKKREVGSGIRSPKEKQKDFESTQGM